MNLKKTVLYIIVSLFLVNSGCGRQVTQSEEQPILLRDREEAEMISRYLNGGHFDIPDMKRVFYDIYMIRMLYSEEIPCLDWSRFIPPGELPVRNPKFSRQLDRCMIYPREIEDGISYLFEDEWTDESGDRITIYHYFGSVSEDVEYIGSYEKSGYRFPEWWTEADRNISLYDSRRK
jgi:hypothetical protein